MAKTTLINSPGLLQAGVVHVRVDSITDKRIFQVDKKMIH